MRYLIQFLINYTRNRKAHPNPRAEVTTEHGYLAINKALLILDVLVRKQEHETQNTKRKLRA